MGESAIQVGVTLATSDSVVGDANINNQIRLSQVVDDFEVPGLPGRGWFDRN